MAWTTPLTAVANATLTAAQWNASLRDNLNETAVAKATVAGRHFVSTGLNSIAEREIKHEVLETSENTTSTTFTNLTTVGPDITLVTGPLALVWVGCTISNSAAAGGAMGFAISGATTSAAQDGASYGYEGAASDSGRGMWIDLVELTAGTNDFQAKYRVASGTGTFGNRRIGAMGL